jgi:Putative bacterial sensory transduction regulator/Sel1 repeat
MSEFKHPVLFPQTVANILQEMGYRGKVNLEGAIPVVESATNGAAFYVNFFSPSNDDPNQGFEAIQFDTGFRLKPDINFNRLLHRCNWFNNEYRFAKITIGGNKNRFITMRFDLAVLSDDEAFLKNQIGFFIYMIRLFVDEVLETEACKGDGCSELFSDALELLYGFKPDPLEAMELYKKSADLGYAGSQCNLGDQYEKGQFLPKSDDFAIYWYTRSAERGEPTAYVSLATLFAEKAVDRDMLIEATKFALLAVEQLPEGINKKTASDCLTQLEEKLNEEDLVVARCRAHEWSPLYQETRLMSDSPRGAALIESRLQSIH